MERPNIGVATPGQARRAPLSVGDQRDDELRITGQRSRILHSELLRVVPHQAAWAANSDVLRVEAVSSHAWEPRTYGHRQQPRLYGWVGEGGGQRRFD